MNTSGKRLHAYVVAHPRRVVPHTAAATAASTLETVGFELRNLSSALKQYALALLEADSTGNFDFMSKEELVSTLQEKHEELGYLIEELTR